MKEVIAILILTLNASFVAPPIYENYIEEVSAEYDLSPAMIEAMIEIESGWDADATSSCGAIGLMQICPQWQQERMERLGCTDLYDAKQNILVGCDYLHELCEKYGNAEEALMFFNMGYRGQELFEEGIISKYANDVLTRASEIERKKEASKWKRLELTN